MQDLNNPFYNQIYPIYNYQLKFLHISFVDTINAAKYVYGSHKTSVSLLCKYFGIDVGNDQHTAPADIALQSQILNCIILIRCKFKTRIN